MTLLSDLECPVCGYGYTPHEKSLVPKQWSYCCRPECGWYMSGVLDVAEEDHPLVLAYHAARSTFEQLDALQDIQSKTMAVECEVQGHQLEGAKEVLIKTVHYDAQGRATREAARPHLECTHCKKPVPAKV